MLYYLSIYVSLHLIQCIDIFIYLYISSSFNQSWLANPTTTGIFSVYFVFPKQAEFSHLQTPRVKVDVNTTIKQVNRSIPLQFFAEIVFPFLYIYICTAGIQRIYRTGSDKTAFVSICTTWESIG